MISLPIVCHCSGGRAYGELVSQSLLPILIWVFFSFAKCVEVTQLVSRFISKGIILNVAIVLVCPSEEVSLRASFLTNLKWNPTDSFFMRENLLSLLKSGQARSIRNPRSP